MRFLHTKPVIGEVLFTKKDKTGILQLVMIVSRESRQSQFNPFRLALPSASLVKAGKLFFDRSKKMGAVAGAHCISGSQEAS